MNWIYLMAGGVAAFGLVICLMLGRTRTRGAPDGDPGSGTRDTAGERLRMADAWFGRAAVIIVLGALAAAFATAARRSDARDMILALSAVALILAAWRFVLAVRVKAHGLDSAEWAFLAAAGALGVAGSYLPI